MSAAKRSANPSTERRKRPLLRPYNGSEAKVEILNLDDYKQDKTLLTIVLREEDHTIGNALTEVLCSMEEVEFAGYNVPHPLEDKILVRIQTKKGASAGDALSKALKNMEAIFGAVKGRFTEAYANFKS